MTIILNSDILMELIDSNNLKILKRSQKISSDCNYYFTPNMGIKLYKPIVKFVDKKFIVFEFQKANNLPLLLLLRHINNILLRELRTKFSETFNKTIHNLFSENDLVFTLRCYLPNNNGKYFIKIEDSDTGASLPFKLPNTNTNYDTAIVEIRNVWKRAETYGFNLELKSIVW
jgi:hypothetical protein